MKTGGPNALCMVVADLTERNKRDKLIADERQRLYDVLETLPAMICLLTPDYRVAFANRSFRDRFGESHGRRCYEYCFGRTEPGDFRKSYEVLRTGKTHNWEFTGPDGSVISAHAFPFADVDGSPLILEMDIDITERRLAEAELVRHRWHLEDLVKERTSQLAGANAQLQADITERKRMEEVLRESRQQLQAIIDGATDTVVFVKDVRGRFITVNSRFETLLGITRDDVRGKSDYDILTRERAEYYRAHDRMVLTTGQPMQVEEVALLADGKEHIFLANKFPLVDVSGKQYAVCAIGVDITAVKQAEGALRESEERLKLAIQAANLATWDWNIVADKVLWSPRCFALYDLAPDTPINHQRFLNALHPDDRARIDKAVRAVLERHEVYDVEMRVIWPDGSLHWISSRGRAYYDDSGRPVRMSGVAMDITERKRAEEALRQQADLMRLSFDAIIVWRLDGGIESWNRGAEQFYGYSEQEALGCVTHKLLKTEPPHAVAGD